MLGPQQGAPVDPPAGGDGGGRLRRRRLIRAALLVAATGAVLLVALLIGIHSPPAKRYVLRELRNALAAQQIDFQAASVDYNLLTLSVAIDDVVIGSRVPAGTPPFARIAHASADLDLIDVLRGRYVVQNGTLVDAEVHLIVDNEGLDNLPHAAEPSEAPSEPAATIDYLIERFAITNGRLRYEDRRSRLDTVVPITAVTVDGDRTTGQQTVRLSTGRGYVRLDDRAIDIERLGGELVVGRDSVQVRHLELGVADSTLSVSGEVISFTDPQSDLALDARLDLGRLAVFAGLAEPVGGVVHGQIKARGPMAGLVVSADVESGNLSFRTLRQIQLSAHAEYDAGQRQARVAEIAVTGLPGEVRGSGVVALGPDAGDSEMRVSIRDLEVDGITAAMRSDYSIASVIAGELHARWPGLDYERAAGDATVTFTPTSAPPKRGVASLAGTIAATAGEEVVNVDVKQLRGLGATVNGRVSLADRQRLGGTLQTRVNDLAGVVSSAEAFLGRPRGSLFGTPIAGPLSLDTTLGGSIDAPVVDAALDAPSLSAGAVSGIAAQVEARYTAEAITLPRVDVAWDMATAHATGRIGLDGAQPLELSVSAQGIPIDTTLAVLGQAVPASGVVSLQADVRGSVTSPRATLTMQGADLQAYGESVGAMSLNAALNGRRLDVSELRLDKPQADGDGELQLRGSYDLDQRSYTLAANGRDLRLTDLTLPDGRPVRGAIEIAADGAGTVEDPAGTLTIGLRDLIVGEQAYGELRVDAKVADREARVHARADMFKVTANARIATPAPYAATADVTIDDLDLASLPVTLETPLAGVLRARVAASGDLAAPQESTVTATVDRLSVVWNDQPIAIDGPAVLRYAARQLAIDWLAVRAGDSVVSLYGTLPLDPEAADGAISLDAKADLASLAAYAPPDMTLQANGTLALQGDVRGSLQRIDPALTLTINNASIDMPALKQPVSDLQGRLDVAAGVLHVSEIGATWGSARFAATGHVPFGWLPSDLPVDVPRPDGAAELHASVTGLDLAALPGAPAELTGSVSMTADVDAPRPDIMAVNGQVTFPDLQLGFGGLTLAQQETAIIGVSAGQVHVDRFELDGTAGHVSLGGGAGLTGDQPVQATLRADLDLSALSSLSESVKAAGRTSLDVTAGGTVPAPTLTGFVELVDGQVSVEEPQIAARAVNLRVDFVPDRVTLSRLDAGLNGGTLSGSGGVALAGTTFSNLDLQLSAADIALDVPLNLRSLSKADIRVTQAQAVSGEGEIVVGGQITIEEAGLTDDINLDTGVLQALTAPANLELTESRNPLLERVRFDLKVNTATPVIVDNNLARAEIDVDVRLLGTPYETGLSGRLDLAEGSELILNERRYQVERGVVTFIDDRSIRPSLDLMLQTTARNYDISIEAAGTPDDTKTTLTSNPTLPEPDIMALLVTGRTLDEMRGEEIDVAKSQVMSYLGGRAGSSLSRGLQRATGLSTVRVEPNLIATETDPGARLTVGQDLTDDLSLVYSTDLVDSSDSIWVAEYDVSRQFTTRAVRQSDDTYRFDVRHEVQFGGEPEPSRGRRARQRVGSVTIEGTLILPEEEIRQRFKLRTGKTYDFFRLREGTRRVTELYGDHDYLQARVRVDRTVRGEEVDLNLRIDPGPQIALIVDGDLQADGILKDARAVWARGVFDSQRADDVRSLIRDELARDGYLDPTIEYELGPDTETPRRAAFHVDRGVHFQRVTMHFEGAGGIDPEELEGVIHEQKLGPQVFTDASTVTDLLRRFYREHGFLTAELERPRYDFDSGSREARVRIAVHEGPLFSVRAVTAEGNRAYGTAALLREIPLVAGDPFFPATAEQSLARIRQLYWAAGYNDVRPAYTLAIDRENGVLDARFTVEEGPRSVVAAIDVTGTARTTERLVREEMEIEAGAPLDLSALGRSRRNLYGTRAFSLVDITRKGGEVEGSTADASAADGANASNPPNLQSTPDQPVVVNVAVREVQPFQVRYGVMFDTERGPGGILDISNRNSLGRARVIGLQSRYDSQVREARLYLNQPSLRPQPVESIVSTYIREERNPATSRADAFNVDRMGAMIQQERRLRNDYVWSYGYRFERARTYEAGLTGPLPAFVNVSPLTTTITRETRDEPLDAATGSFLSHAFSFSPEFLGSDVRFIKYFGQYFHYVPLKPPTRRRFTNEILRPRLVYAVGVRAGLSNGIGAQEVPLSERFLAGGSTTLRGFEQNSLGPIGPDGVPLGGEAMFVINNELRFPLIGIVDGVVFADVGNVFGSVSDFSLTDLRESGGVGVRIRTPWLLVRMDYGMPFDRRAGEARGRFFFSIGQAF